MRSATVALFLVLALIPASALATTHVVLQQGLTFVPKDLLIVKHDTVRWVWTAAVHTVTNGTSSGDPDAGLIFNGNLAPGSQIFEHTFDDPGVFPYFCSPHEFFGMTGTITVDEQVGVEPSTWGFIKQLHTRPAEPAGN